MDGLQRDGSTAVRAAAAPALLQLGVRLADPAAVSALRAALAALHEVDEVVRCEAASALCGFGDASAIPTLGAVALHDQFPYVRFAAVRVLLFHSAHVCARSDATAAAEPLLGDCCEALGLLGGSQAIDTLLATFQTVEMGERTRAAAGRALTACGALGDAPASGAFLAELRGPAAGSHWVAAAEALGAGGESRAIALLLVRLGETGRRVRGVAAVVLGATAQIWANKGKV
jgi:HEAT repeat protein